MASEDGEKSSNSGHYEYDYKKKMDLGWETNVKVDSKIFDLRNWNHRVAIN